MPGWPNQNVLDALLVKVDRAYKHIIELNAETLRFLGEGGPYNTIFEDDPNTLQRTYYLRIRKETPSQFSAMIGDIAQNLRSSLDHIAWPLVKSSPMTPKAEDRNIYFPIFKTAQQYQAEKMRKISGMTAAAIQAIDRIEPHYRPTGDPSSGIGNGAHLYILHEINKLDKHRLLVPIWGSTVSHTIPRSKFAELPEGLRATLGNGEIFLSAGCPVHGAAMSGMEQWPDDKL